MEIALLGHMGRDEAAADRLAGHTLHVIGQWSNPGLVEKAQASGGAFHTINSITNTEGIADLVQAIEPDMFFTNFDDALAAGVVDAVKRRVTEKRMPDLLIPCPDREGSMVEWDKFFLREIVDEINPDYNPLNFMVTSERDALNAIGYFEDQDIQVVLKPRNLTSGKGVKVMGKHFDTYEEARHHAREILDAIDQKGLEVQEKLEGHEFTLQIFTDGNTMINPPVTYDYPYREDGDIGPGTGGMGTFSMKDGLLPFVTQEDYDEAMALSEQLLIKLKERGIDYKGVLYPTFFKTEKGLKIVEVNARGGDPEQINTLDLLEDGVDFAQVLTHIAIGKLVPEDVGYKKAASAMVYLVSPQYGYGAGQAQEFSCIPEVIEALECKVRFAAARQIGPGKYASVSTSRVIGLSSLGKTPWEARSKIHEAIANGFVHPLELQYRYDVADREYISNLG